MSGTDNSNGQSIRHESEGWEFESPSGRGIFCLKNFDTFIRTSVRVSKMNDVARSQLTFQMLALLQKYIFPRKYRWSNSNSIQISKGYPQVLRPHQAELVQVNRSIKTQKIQMASQNAYLMSHIMKNRFGWYRTNCRECEQFEKQYWPHSANIL